MKCILIGYPGSQKIIKASEYLINKYLSYTLISPIFINYTGPTFSWCAFVAGYLSRLTDDYVIFTLDDYLISNYLDVEMFRNAQKNIQISEQAVCAKLCHCTVEENIEYPATTQYSIWKREYLIELLLKVNGDPWQFEINGSKFFDKKFLYCPCIQYFTNSSISSKWEGVRLDGLSDEDIKYLKENKYV